MKKDYHGSYLISCRDFTRGSRCSYCSSIEVHIYDSFGYANLDKIMSWVLDEENSLFRTSPCSDKRQKFKCEECGEIFEKQIKKITTRNEWCPSCKASKGEKRIKQWLDMNNIKYAHDEEYFDDLLSDLGNPLRPDFILPDYKIWIEYDGEFHFKKMYDDDNYETLKIHDKRKDNYAKENGWNLIRIPYTDFDNIEEILGEILDKLGEM